MLLQPGAKRLMIFAYHDPGGVVDDYVVYLLSQMRRRCAEQWAVINGEISPEAEEKIRPYCDEIIYRPNQGFDVSAYKEAFLGLENPENYEEILFYNQTIFGPVCPLEPMFAEMDARDLDFWGLTRHKGAHTASWDNSACIAPHLQSFFFAVRKSLFLQAEFTEYWRKLPPIEGYWDAVGKHEVVFTSHFEKLGYHWQAYLCTEDLEAYNDYPLMGMPTELLQRGCPFIKRKSFLCGRHSYSTVPQGAAPRQLYNWLMQNPRYPLRYITQNLLRTAAPAQLRDILTLYFPLPQGNTADSGSQNTAAVLWFAQHPMAEILLRAAQNLPAHTALFCLFATAELEEEFGPQLPKWATCCKTGIHGFWHLFGPLWEELAPFTYLLYLSNGLPLLLDEFADETSLETAIECLAPEGCLALLNQHPALGLLVPPTPLHQENLSLGLNWPRVASELKPNLEAAGFHLPLGEDGPGFALRGGMFFARLAAVAPLARFAYEEGHFTGEYPGFEYLPPLAAQSGGWLTATACRFETAANLWENSRVLLRDMTAKWATARMRRSDQLLFRQQAILDFYHERRHQMTLEQAFAAKLSMRQKIWICLQILVKPETFEKWHKTNENLPALPPDELE